MELIIGILAIFVLVSIFKLIFGSMKFISKIVINGVIGLVLLYFFNAIGGAFGTNIEISIVNALIAGVFGIPGIILLLLV